MLDPAIKKLLDELHNKKLIFLPGHGNDGQSEDSNKNITDFLPSKSALESVIQQTKQQQQQLADQHYGSMVPSDPRSRSGEIPDSNNHGSIDLRSNQPVDPRFQGQDDPRAVRPLMDPRMNNRSSSRNDQTEGYPAQDPRRSNPEPRLSKSLPVEYDPNDPRISRDHPDPASVPPEITSKYPDESASRYPPDPADPRYDSYQSDHQPFNRPPSEFGFNSYPGNAPFPQRFPHPQDQVRMPHGDPRFPSRFPSSNAPNPRFSKYPGDPMAPRESFPASNARPYRPSWDDKSGRFPPRGGHHGGSPTDPDRHHRKFGPGGRGSGHGRFSSGNNWPQHHTSSHTD